MAAHRRRGSRRGVPPYLVGVATAVVAAAAFVVVGDLTNVFLGGVAAAVLAAAGFALVRARQGRPISRPTRERLAARLGLLAIVAGCLAGVAAWRRDIPEPPEPDPPQVYLAISGYLTEAWQKAYKQPGRVVSVVRSQEDYWRAVVADGDGCWSAAVVLVGAQPAMVPSPTPLACPDLLQARLAVGEPVEDPAGDPAAKAAVLFFDRWLNRGDYSLLVTPAAGIRPPAKKLDPDRPIVVRRVDTANLPVTDRMLWLDTVVDDRPVGALITMSNASGRWEVAALRGGPPVSADLAPITGPTTSTTVLDSE